MNTPTPRTNAEHAQFPMGGFTLEFARQLERELTAAWENIAQYAGINVSLNIDLHLAKQDIVELTEQRDRLLEEREQWRLSSVCRDLTAQLNEAREKLKAVTEQRDKLAELSGFGEFDKPTEP